jgi:hypothetical protein
MLLGGFRELIPAADKRRGPVDPPSLAHGRDSGGIAPLVLHVANGGGKWGTVEVGIELNPDSPGRWFLNREARAR